MASCNKCEQKWSGLKMAHCAAGCCKTFSTVSNFDRHRIGVKVPLVCVEPESVGLEANRYGTYRMPSETDIAGKFH